MDNKIYLKKLLQDLTAEERTTFSETPFVCHHTPENGSYYFQYLVVDLRYPSPYSLKARFRELEDAISYAKSIS